MKLKRLLLVVLVLLFGLPLAVFAYDEPELEIILVTDDANLGNQSNYIYEEQVFVKWGYKFIEFRDIDNNVLLEHNFVEGKSYSYTFKIPGLIFLNLGRRGLNYSKVSLVESSEFRFEYANNYGVLINGEQHIEEEFEGDFSFYWNLNESNSKTDVFINDVENPLSIDEIIKIVRPFAYDGHDGNITNKITYVDNYTPNSNKIGNYEVIFSVTNVSNKTTMYTLNIYNMYYGAPTIIGTTNQVYEYNAGVTIDDVLLDYQVSDKHDKNVKVRVKKNDVIFDQVGQYDLILESTNQHQISSDYHVTVDIVDKTKPVFTDSHQGEVTFNFKELPLTSDKLKAGLKAYDEVDGNISYLIKVTTDRLKKEVGTYVLEYEVSDKAGNTAYYERTYHVISEYEPEFFVSENLLSIQDINNLTIEQIATIILGLSEINYQSYQVLEDTYTINSQAAGDYIVTLLVTDENNEQHVVSKNINVFTLNEEKTNNQVLPIVIISIVALSLGSLHFFIKRKVHKQ